MGEQQHSVRHSASVLTDIEGPVGRNREQERSRVKQELLREGSSNGLGCKEDKKTGARRAHRSDRGY